MTGNTFFNDHPDFSDRSSYPDDFRVGDVFMQYTADYISKTVEVSTVMLTCYQMGKWSKATSGVDFVKTGLPHILYRAVAQQLTYIEIPDCLKHPSYKFINLRMPQPSIRFIGCIPIVDHTNKVAGAITLMDRKPKMLFPSEISFLETISRLTACHMKCVTDQMLLVIN